MILLLEKFNVIGFFGRIVVIDPPSETTCIAKFRKKKKISQDFAEK